MIFIKSLINLLLFLSIDNSKKDFVLYCESSFYRDHFVDLIDNLLSLDQQNVIILTSNIDDFNFFKKKTKCFFIKNYFLLQVFFKLLNCKFMIMTLTDLGQHLQKSKNCKNYVYFFHALASTHEIYTNTAFKNYDIILTNGEYQSKELILAEEKFDFPKKEIVNSGYFFLDYIKRKAKLDIKKKQNILFAPSWNYSKKNLFEDHSINIINKLLENNFNITLRPHPEHFKRSKDKINKIKNTFLKNENFDLDSDISNLRSLEKAELVITDNSSIVLEFVLVFKRPIIYIDYEKKIHNPNRSQIPIETIDEKFKKEFGATVSIKDLNGMPNLCLDLIENKNQLEEKVKIFNEKYFSNLGSSANFAAKYLISKKDL